MADLVHRLRTACSPESPLGKLFSEAADALDLIEISGARPKSLRVYLAENNIRQRDFATSLGTSPVVLSRLIMGGRTPGVKLIRRIEAATSGQVNFHSWFPPLPSHPPLTDEAKLLRSAAFDELGALDGELLK